MDGFPKSRVLDSHHPESLSPLIGRGFTNKCSTWKNKMCLFESVPEKNDEPMRASVLHPLSWRCGCARFRLGVAKNTNITKTHKAWVYTLDTLGPLDDGGAWLTRLSKIVMFFTDCYK